jgi:hypothetical protein
MKALGINMIAAYSPQTRGRSERAFRTHQDRLPRELALDCQNNRYVKEHYLPAFNQEFRQPPLEDGSAFVTFCGKSLDDILCEQFEHTVGNDNCVHFAMMKLQIPANP